MPLLNRTKFVFSIRNIIINIILMLLVFTPIFSIQESLGLIFGGIVDQSTALTPVYVKAMKDLGFLIIILAGFIRILKLRSINKIAFLVFMYIALVLIFSFFYKNNLLIFLAGIRWILSIFLIIFLIPYIHRNLLEIIAKLLAYLFVFHFIFQIIQLFFASGWFGLNALGLSARNPGMFFMPNTSAFFTIMVLFFTMFYLKINFFRKLIFLLSPLSLFLTASGTGVATYIAIMSVYLLRQKYFALITVFEIILFFVLFYTIEDITGRAGIIEESFGTRIELFFSALANSNFFSQNLGYGTSTGYLLANEYGLSFDMIATDSTYASIIVNLGLSSFVLTIVILFVALVLAWLNKNKQILICIIIFGLFSSTTSILEAYPMNLLFSVLAAYYLGNYKKENHETPNNPCLFRSIRTLIPILSERL
ncbi:MAG TPA: hypothetical protein PLE17_07235, partial [Soehngenia sp.]|nr:hypothetical protein [Soehngenia sp.]